ncbi:MAG: hypothetical protein ACYS7M_13695, partial [Planctomycetota bacterium]
MAHITDPVVESGGALAIWQDESHRMAGKYGHASASSRSSGTLPPRVWSAVLRTRAPVGDEDEEIHHVDHAVGVKVRR